MELVSPPLRGEAGLQQVEQAMAVMRKYSASVIRGMGLHVHVGHPTGRWCDARRPFAEEGELDQLKDLCYNFMVLQPALDSIMPFHWQHNPFATSPMAERWEWHEHNCTYSLEPGYCCCCSACCLEMEPLVRNCMNMDALLNNYCPAGRHYKLNLYALFKHGTVEFRQPASTTVAATAIGYVRLFVALCELSCTGHRAEPPPAGTHPAPVDVDEAFGRLLRFFGPDQELCDWLQLQRPKYRSIEHKQQHCVVE